MVAKPQYKLTAADLTLVLTLVRTATLAQAGERLGVDATTVFRSLQRIERGVGHSLFERTRSGYKAGCEAQSLAAQGELVEAAVAAARESVQGATQHGSMRGAPQVAGTVRITTTDTILHALVAPALHRLRVPHPLLEFEIHTGNELTNLTRRDADIAVRATTRPPQHLVGKRVGSIQVALYTKKGSVKAYDEALAAQWAWIAPDDALPEHPSVLWRKRHFPKVVPRWRVSSILTVAEGVAMGLGVGMLPLFLGETRRDLVRLTEPIDECTTELWLLTHPEAKRLRRVSTVYAHLAQCLELPS
jgi:DNA-binding transcriptional LysR family regulator